MKAVVAVLGVLVCVWAETLQPGVEVQAEDERITENEISVQFDIWAELKELRDMVVKQRVQLQELKQVNDALKVRVASTENDVEILKKDQPKVAFTAASGYQGHYGPFTTDVTMTFRKVFTNIGNAYNPITGIFTAPVRGVYHFTHTAFGPNSSHWIGVKFFKNEQVIFALYDHPNGKHKYVTRAVNILLEKGDVVYLKLIINYQIYDDANNHITFGGFLLFPL